MEHDRHLAVRSPYQEAFGSEYAALGRICASAQSLEKLLQEGLQIIQGAVGCHAGGVRLSQPDGSLPFYVSRNLDPDFYRTEDLGTVKECICGAVASGTGLGSLGFTPFGTFVTNGLQDYAARLETSQWLALRGRCILTGYESVAIIPLRTEAALLGVIYLADPREGLFTREMLAFLEAASSLLAAAIPRLRELEGTGAAGDSAELLASLGHDLRTPLVPVKGLLNLILSEKVGPLSPKQKELLDICQLSIDREIELIDNLLESSRLRSGCLQLERAVFDLRGAIRDALHYVQPLARERGTHIELSLSAEELPVLGDRRRLLRVFANLLSNAIKYGRQGGRVDLKTRAEGREVVVRVIDDGPGVPEEEREKIFEWLYRGPAAAGTPGSGLGLAIAHDVAALHGGQIKVESSQPSVFAVRLPLAPEPHRGLSEEELRSVAF